MYVCTEKAIFILLRKDILGMFTKLNNPIKYANHGLNCIMVHHSSVEFQITKTMRIINSPDNKLIISKRHFQRITFCFNNRPDFAKNRIYKVLFLDTSNWHHLFINWSNNEIQQIAVVYILLIISKCLKDF